MRAINITAAIALLFIFGVVVLSMSKHTEPYPGSFAEEAVLCYQRSLSVFKAAADARDKEEKERRLAKALKSTP